MNSVWLQTWLCFTFIGVMKNISVEAKFTHETWHQDLQDPESEVYRSFRDKLILNVGTLEIEGVTCELRFSY